MLFLLSSKSKLRHPHHHRPFYLKTKQRPTQTAPKAPLHVLGSNHGLLQYNSQNGGEIPYSTHRHIWFRPTYTYISDVALSGDMLDTRCLEQTKGCWSWCVRISSVGLTPFPPSTSIFILILNPSLDLLPGTTPSMTILFLTLTYQGWEIGCIPVFNIYGLLRLTTLAYFPLVSLEVPFCRVSCFPFELERFISINVWFVLWIQDSVLMFC